jgi:hypothetical protein
MNVAHLPSKCMPPCLQRSSGEHFAASGDSDPSCISSREPIRSFSGEAGQRPDDRRCALLLVY